VKPFAGFPSRAQAIAIPSLFFVAVLPYLEDLAELKVCLHIFWRLSQKGGYPRFVTYGELAADPLLRAGLRDGAALATALEQAVARGLLLTLPLEQAGATHQLYFINDEPSRRAVDRIARGELSPSLPVVPGPEPGTAGQPAPAPPANIFTLYEQNIGLLTPLLAEELAEAERLYPASWIEEAFREAVNHNKRSWRYISRILERWASEGKDRGEARRYTEAGRPARPARGRYRHPIWG